MTPRDDLGRCVKLTRTVFVWKLLHVGPGHTRPDEPLNQFDADALRQTHPNGVCLEIASCRARDDMGCSGK